MNATATSTTLCSRADTRWTPMATRLNIYYGAADCAIALARASVRSLLEWLDAHGSCERRQRAEDL